MVQGHPQRRRSRVEEATAGRLGRGGAKGIRSWGRGEGRPQWGKEGRGKGVGEAAAEWGWPWQGGVKVEYCGAVVAAGWRQPAWVGKKVY